MTDAPKSTAARSGSASGEQRSIIQHLRHLPNMMVDECPQWVGSRRKLNGWTAEIRTRTRDSSKVHSLRINCIQPQAATEMVERNCCVLKLAGINLAAVILCAAHPVAAQPAPTPPHSVGPAYRINPGDEIEVMVWGDERLQRTVRILPDGTFSFPLVGQVLAAGQLPPDLERLISAKLRPQYKDVVPQVTVSVKNPSGYQFSVVGKVKSPGTFTPGRYVNALEAVGIAGGPTEFAQIGGARILRKQGLHITTVRPRLAALLKGEMSQLSADDVPDIQSGDTLIVP